MQHTVRAAAVLLWCFAARASGSGLPADHPVGTERKPLLTAFQQTASGGRYRVIAERTYFFDAPLQAKPNGRYLLRGDVLYAEDEVRGFVKTSFKEPNGATVSGWLKAEELGRLTTDGRPAETARTPRPAPPARPVTAPDAPNNKPAAKPAARASRTPPSPVSGAETAVVQVARSYFYNSPDLAEPRKAHCVRGDKVRLGESRGDAVYVTFTNWEKVTTTGWMRRDALRFSR